MKRHQLFAILLALTLLLTACGTAGGKNDPSKQNTPPQESVQTEPLAETTALTVPTAEELPIWSILLSSNNGLSGRGDFVYITPAQIMTGQTTRKDIITGSPLRRMADLEQIQITEIPEGAFETLCAELRALRYDLLPAKIERPENVAVEDASDYYLSIRDSWISSYDSGGYAATHYHEGFAEIYETIHRHVDALVKEHTPKAAEIKPIASIMLSSYNGYSQLSSFTYLTPTQMAAGGMSGCTVITGDPIADPGFMHMKVADIPAGIFAELCAGLWALRFDLLPTKITQPEGKAISDASNSYLTIYFEDGTAFTSGGYAAGYFHERFGAVWGYLQAHANALIDEYEVPEKEIKDISAILCYTYQNPVASGKSGYTFYHYTYHRLVTGQSAVSPTELVDVAYAITPNRAENGQEKSFSGEFDPLVQELRKLTPQTLPEVIEPDPENVIFDGDTQYIVIYFADGTTVTSSGYCASEYNEQFAAVWDLLERARKSGMP